MQDAQIPIPTKPPTPQAEAGTSPTPASVPTLSVVMIVRDEEENLPRCLESLKSLGWDQLVVVDTGSHDRTMEIAAEHGAEIHEHEVVPWSFSAARNLALQYATGDWILSIDADETLEDAHLIKGMLARLPEKIGAAGITMLDMQGGEVALTQNVKRFFRRDRNPVWDSAYHNLLSHQGEQALLLDGRIRHYGYDLPLEKMEAKLARTEEIILRELQKGPGNYRGYFFLAHIENRRGNHQGALSHGSKYVKHARKRPLFNPAIYHVLFASSLALGEQAEADRWLTLAREDIPYDLDITYDMVVYGEWVVRPDLVIDGARRFLTLWDAFEENRAQLASRFVYHHNPRSLIFVLRKAAVTLAGEASGAMDRFKQALEQLSDEDAAAEREYIQADLKAAGTTWINLDGEEDPDHGHQRKCTD